MAPLPPAHSAGGEGGTADGGGDFAYYSSGVRDHAKSAASELRLAVLETPQEFFDEVFAGHRVNRARLANILSHVEERLTETRFRKNPQGYVEPLQLDFGLNAQGEEAIFILSGFYDWGVRQLEAAGTGFKRLQAEDRLVKQMKLKLFKEALHHFGIIHDDQARDLARHFEQLGARAAKQFEDCQVLQQGFPGSRCLKSWQASYWQTADAIEDWESRRLGTGKVILGSAQGITLEIDLAVKGGIEVKEPKYQIHGVGECVERTYERTDCTIKNEWKNGELTSLRAAYRISLKYEKDNDFEIPLAARSPLRVTYSIGGDRDDEQGTVSETKVILLPSSMEARVKAGAE